MEEFGNSEQQQLLVEHLESLEIKINGWKKNVPAGLRLIGPTLPPLYRVPDVLRKQNQDPYSPSIVSIGPLHSGKKHLQDMEAVKVSYMYFLVKRTGDFEGTKKRCLGTMLELRDRVRGFYGTKLDENIRLAEMMLIDGCFMIELLCRRRHCQRKKGEMKGRDDSGNESEKGHEEDDSGNESDNSRMKCHDPIFDNPYSYYAVQQDLLLLENQIPYFILEELFTEARLKPFVSTVSELVVCFFEDKRLETCPVRREPPDVGGGRHILHLLHFFHLSHIPIHIGFTRNQHQAQYQHRTGYKYNVTQLHKAGVKFEADKDSPNLFNIRLNVGGYMFFFLLRRVHFKIPPFYIDESVKVLLRNLIAFEQCYPNIEKYFTCYTFLMAILINSEKDVKLLEGAGIIHNRVGSSEAASHVFKDICKNAVPTKFFYRNLCVDVAGFCTPWRLAVCNVWVRMTLIVAIILNLLTLVQTIFTILPYFVSS